MKNLVYILFSAVLLSSCGGNDDENFTKEEIAEVLAIANYSPIILERGGIKLTEFTDFPPFEDVETSIATQNQTFKMGMNKIEFKNKFFNLGEKTAEETIHNVRLNEGGQYLGVLTPKKPTEKVIQSYFETDVDKGDNYFLCFLSRSYDVSVRNPKASFLFKINADPSGCYSETNLADTVVALLQPNGHYSSTEKNKIMFDFFLKNVSLDGGNYLSVLIDNVEFKIEKWAPFIIQGLDYGKHIIEIDLRNKEGKSIRGIMPQKLKSEIIINESDLFEE